jgi:hypothetical protein
VIVIFVFLVVIRDLGVIRFTISPNETQAVPIVDSNTVLPRAVTAQSLQGVAWRTKVMEAPRCIQLEEPANRDLFDRLKLSGPHPLKDPLGICVAERADHLFIVYR